jgi:hypothetical protein
MIMDESKVMGNKKIVKNSKIWEVLDYYHNLPTITAWSSMTTYFLDV